MNREAILTGRICVRLAQHHFKRANWADTAQHGRLAQGIFRAVLLWFEWHDRLYLLIRRIRLMRDKSEYRGLIAVVIGTADAIHR